GFPRGVAAIGGDVYVVDMGGWRRNHGRLLKLADHGRGKSEVVLSGLDEPNALVPAPRGGLYLGLAGKVAWLDPAAADAPATLREIVAHLPDTGRHPLAAIALAGDGSLYVNVGSATDHCEAALGAPVPTGPCPETVAAPPRASILHVVPRDDAAIDARTLQPYARGLRNSMALAVLPAGDLVAAVNARDAINHADPALSDDDLPHDAYVRVERGADYGFPYCYDGVRASPEYPDFDCRSKREPTLLLPAHAAPLGMLLYRGKALPDLDGTLLIGYHGYRANGHRIVALAVDAHGRPRGEPKDIVSAWDFARDDHPLGAVVALWQLDDGSVLVSEDDNGTLLRLARESP
ncbi:MAG TPA: PQQ-dependent sugar dehydrogenase, partial [Rudaea sp.]|nr:PQQ-dependent sugar dehydrogenase [Rudaea sp.]